jgi:hypothetical protein
MADNAATVNIPKDVIDPIVRAEIASAIARAMGDSATLVREMVSNLINIKCDRDGKISEYHSSNKFSYVEVAVGKLLREMIEQELQAVLESKRNEVRKELAAQLAKRNSKLVQQLANAFAESMCGSVKYGLKFSVSVEGDPTNGSR